MNGFLGTGATIQADLNLTIQILMGIALLAGMIHARQQVLPCTRCLPGKSDIA